MSTSEQVAAKLRAKCKTKEFDLGDGDKITIRELTPGEKKAMNAKVWIVGPDGEPVLFDKAGDDGKPIEVGTGWRHFRKGVSGETLNPEREWLLASMTPVSLVDTIMGDDTPESFRRELIDTAQRLSGMTVQDAAGN